MKDKVIELIIILGTGLNELVFDFYIDEIQFNSIEWYPEDDKVFLHILDEENELDYYCDFESMDIDKQLKMYKILSIFLN